MLSWLQLIFFGALIISPLICFSSSSWLMMWFSLEINMISFLSLTMYKNNLSVNSMIKYFMIQAFASSIFFFMMGCLKLNLWSSLDSNIIFLLMCLKLGASPLHFWFPQVAEGLPWLNILILSTWQKIIPLFVCSLCLSSLNSVVSILSGLFGTIGMLNQTSLRKLFAFSSISHLAWMMPSLSFNSAWISYLMIYSIIFLLLILILEKKNLSSTLQCKFLSKNEKLSLVISALSLSGLPPFMGFIPKWLMISSFSSTLSVNLAILIMSSLLGCFVYLRMAWGPIMLMNLSSMKYESWVNSTILINTFGLLMLTPLIV